MLVPLFTYCSTITCQASKTYKKKVQSLEDRAGNIIFKGRPLVTEIPSIDNLMKKRICQFVYKCLSGDICENFVDYFEPMMNNTRNRSSLLRLPKIRLESSKKVSFITGQSAFTLQC